MQGAHYIRKYSTRKAFLDMISHVHYTILTIVGRYIIENGGGYRRSHSAGGKSIFNIIYYPACAARVE